MATEWQEYQVKVAAIFRSLGATADVDAHLKGARGEHDVDVWVTFNKFGLAVRWLVECKLWKASVPKEKVVALYQIAQDVGADRALLFSESGFQAGAIKACANTNVVLTSLDEFRTNAWHEIVTTSITIMLREVELLHSRIKAFWIDERGHIAPIPGADLDSLLGLDGAILFFKLSFSKALSGQYPVAYPGIADFKFIQSDDAASFLENAARSLSVARTLTAKWEATYQRATGTVADRATALVLAVQELLDAASQCLFVGDVPEDRFEHLRFQALGKMKAVGRAIQGLSGSADPAIWQRVLLLKQLLVDTVYLYLTLPTIPRQQWDATVTRVTDELEALDRLASMI